MLRWKTVLVSVPMVLTVAWAIWLRPSFLFDGPGTYIFVSGVSMQPTMYTGDLAVLRRSEFYEVGDVVAFPVDNGIVIHRVIGGNAATGYVIQGDNRREPDIWTPKADQILGRMLFHVPGAASVLKPLQGPRAFGVFIAILAALSTSEAVRYRRKGGRTVKLPTSSSGGAPASSGARLLETGALAEVPRALAATFVGACVLAGLGALLAFYAFRQPIVTSKMTPTLQYTQSGAFDYTIEVAPATIYPAGVVKPQAGAEAKDAARPEQAVFTRLANAINIDYHYRVEGAPDAEGSAFYGSIRTDLEVRAADGWTRTTPLTPPRQFEGGTVDEHTRIDLRALAALLNRIEAETGFEAKSYDLLITPVVEVKGFVGSNEVREAFTSSLLVKLDPQRVAPQGALELTKPTARAELVRTPTSIGLGPQRATVAPVRVASSALVAGAGTVAVLLAGVIFLGIGRGEDAKIRARYGSMLLHVAAAEDETVRDRVRVVSMRDLVRLAQRAGVLILEEREPSGPRYFVRDGDAVYEFVPDRPRRRHRFGTFAPQPRPEAEPAAPEA